MGWFDGNPGRLWAHPPEAIGPRYVEAMGGLDRVVELAQAKPSTTATSAGRQRYSITPSSPTSTTTGARALYADTLEQLAYGAENAVWRNFFLSGATELREANFGTPTQTASPSILGQLTPEQMFDSFAISVNGPRAWDLDLVIDVTFVDVATDYRLTLRNGVLVHRKVPADPATAQATVTLASKSRLLAFAAGDTTSPGVEVTGDEGALPALLGVLDQPDPNFNIVTP